MTEGMDGFDVRLNERGLLIPHPLVALTVIDPDVNKEEKFTVTELVPWPAVTVAFAGAVQL